MAFDRVKIFRSSSINDLENGVNKWLEALSLDATIQRTETAMSSKGDIPVIVVSVWYSDPDA